nr:DNA topoisomerase 2-like [Tanacetum cinerariifolium]
MLLIVSCNLMEIILELMKTTSNLHRIAEEAPKKKAPAKRAATMKEQGGTRWSLFVPNYNPRDIIANLIHLLNGEAMVRMDPWYKCFNGAIMKTEDTRYISKGLIEEIKSKSALSITELPVRRGGLRNTRNF